MRRIVVLLVLLSGCFTQHPGQASDADVATSWSLESTGTTGHILLRLDNDRGIELSGAATSAWDTDDLNPHQLLFISDEGNVSVVWGSPFYDNAHWGSGDGVVYVGAGAENVQAPVVAASEDAVRSEPIPTRRFDATGGHLLLFWANEQHPLQVHLTFSAGTRITTLDQGEARTVELKDFTGGVRLGTPAVSLSALDTVQVPAGQGQVVVVGKIYRSDASEGELVLRSGDQEHSVPLRGPRTEVNPLCCFAEDALFFSAPEDVGLHVWQAGNSRSTKVLLVVVELSAPWLPVVFDLHTLAR